MMRLASTLSIVAAVVLTAPPPRTPGELREAGSLRVRRASHTSTVLPDGRVLVVGGFEKGPDGYSQIYHDTAELFDPIRGTFVSVSSPAVARAGHTATALPDGRILLVGGWTSGGRTAAVEIFDPSSSSFLRVADLSAPRAGHTATALGEGRVLIAGGETEKGPATQSEIFDPRTGRFLPAAKLREGRLGHSATLFTDGRVLMAGGRKPAPTGGGVLASTEIYDPARDAFVAGPALAVARYKHAAARLADGRVLIVGGSDERDWTGMLASAELFALGASRFEGTGALLSKRFKLPGTAVALRNGLVLIAGGSEVAEVFDPRTGRFERAGSFPTPLYYATATVLGDGRVLIVGGYDKRPQATNRAWIFTPSKV
jgi:hypothetical protein